MLIALALLLGFVNRPRPQLAGDFWDDPPGALVTERIWVKEGAERGSILNAAPQKEEAPKTKSPHLRIWARKPDDLVNDPPLMHEPTLNYKGASLKGVQLREWQGNSNGAGDPEPRDPSGILQQSGDTISFNITKLVESRHVLGVWTAG